MTKMTPAEAVTFDRESITNMVTAEQACPSGECEAYQDIFTYNRWQALGHQVRKGEHGTKITVFVPIKDKNTEQVRATRPKLVVVFCRCQVDKIVTVRDS